MTVRKSLLFIAIFGLAALFVHDLNAQVPIWNHKAVITLYRQAEIPGRILPPGTYVFKLLEPEIHVAQVLSSDETEIFGIFFTSTADRKRKGELDTQVVLEPRTNGIQTWDRVVGWFSP